MADARRIGFDVPIGDRDDEEVAADGGGRAKLDEGLAEEEESVACRPRPLPLPFPFPLPFPLPLLLPLPPLGATASSA